MFRKNDCQSSSFITLMVSMLRVTKQDKKTRLFRFARAKAFTTFKILTLQAITQDQLRINCEERACTSIPNVVQCGLATKIACLLLSAIYLLNPIELRRIESEENKATDVHPFCDKRLTSWLQCHLGCAAIWLILWVGIGLAGLYFGYNELYWVQVVY